MFSNPQHFHTGFIAGKSNTYPMANSPQNPIVFMPSPSPAFSANTPPNPPLLCPSPSQTSSLGDNTAFQPIPLMPIQTLPVIPIQTPSGPQFYYIGSSCDPNALQAGTPPIPQSFLLPEVLHPIQQQSEPLKRCQSNSSVDGRSSFDGSEISDSGEPRYRSLQRGYSYSNESVSRDGYGSDYHTSDVDTAEEESPKIGVESDKMFYSARAGHRVNTHIDSANLQGMTQHYKKTEDAHKKTYSQSTKQDYNQLNERNLARNMNRCINVSKGMHVYSDRKKRPTSKERQEELFKTELCNYWINGQKCRFGKRCIFAHGQHELRCAQRKVERNRLLPPFRKQLVSQLNKLSQSNFDTIATELLCTTVESVRDDDKASMIVVRELFNKAIVDPSKQKCYAEFWRKLLNVHPMKQVLAIQMMDMCMSEYKRPRREEAGYNAMKWIASMCAKGVLFGEETVHKILCNMFSEQQSEQSAQLWCKLIEALKNTINTSKYFPQLNKLKKDFTSSVRFMIMDLEDLKKRNWVRRQ